MFKSASTRDLRLERRGSIAGRAALAIAAVLVSAGPALAGGFYVPYQSGAALQSALAGSSARTDSPSFFFFNPATIADTTSPTISVEASAFIPDVSISVQSATAPVTQGGFDMTAFGGSGHMTGEAFGPAVFAAIPVHHDVVLGFGFSAPFAAILDADPAWAGRFHLLKTDMRAYNGSAALAWRINEMIAIAGGIQVQWFEGEFDRSESLPVVTPLGLAFVEQRGFLKGDSVGVGFTAGILLTPWDGTQIGVGYRSEIVHDLEGSAGVRTPGAAADTAFFEIPTPHVVSIGLVQDITDSVRLLAEAVWMDWSRFRGFDIAFGSGRPNELRPQAWDDSYLFAFGIEADVTEATTVRGGIHFDSGVSDGGDNTISPDGDRTMVAFGLTHTPNDRVEISAHYAHVFFKDAPISVVDPLRTGSLQATFESDLDIFGASVKIAIGG